MCTRGCEARLPLIGPLFLYHPESESSAVWLLVNSRLAANSQAISFGVLSPSARWGRLSLYSRRQVSIICFASASVANQWASKHSDRSVPLNDSTYALSVGFPGREKSICTPA